MGPCSRSACLYYLPCNAGRKIFYLYSLLAASLLFRNAALWSPVTSWILTAETQEFTEAHVADFQTDHDSIPPVNLPPTMTQILSSIQRPTLTGIVIKKSSCCSLVCIWISCTPPLPMCLRLLLPPYCPPPWPPTQVSLLGLLRKPRKLGILLDTLHSLVLLSYRRRSILFLNTKST